MFLNIKNYSGVLNILYDLLNKSNIKNHISYVQLSKIKVHSSAVLSADERCHLGAIDRKKVTVDIKKGTLKATYRVD